MRSTDTSKKRNHLLNGRINNSQDITTGGQKSTTSTGFVFAGARIFDITNYKKTKIQRVLFRIASGTLSDGMTVELFDKTNSTQITTVVFTSGQDDIILPSADIKSYFDSISTAVILNVNIKSAAGASVEIVNSILQVKGKFLDE